MAGRKLDITTTYKTGGAETKVRAVGQEIKNVGDAAALTTAKSKGFTAGVQAMGERAGAMAGKVGEAFKSTQSLAASIGKSIPIVGTAMGLYSAAKTVYGYFSGAADAAAASQAAFNAQVADSKKKFDAAKTAALAFAAAIGGANLADLGPEEILGAAQRAEALKATTAEYGQMVKHAGALKETHAEYARELAKAKREAQGLSDLDVAGIQARERIAFYAKKEAEFAAALNVTLSKANDARRRALAIAREQKRIAEQTKAIRNVTDGEDTDKPPKPPRPPRAPRVPKPAPPAAAEFFGMDERLDYLGRVEAEQALAVAQLGALGDRAASLGGQIFGGLADRVSQGIARIREYSAAVAAGTAQVKAFALAEGKAAAASVLSAALRGESVKAALNAALTGIATQAPVEAAFEGAKGWAASAVGSPSAAMHFTAAKGFLLAAAIAGAGAVATGGFGGGGGGGTPSLGAEPSRRSLPRGGTGQDGTTATTLILDLGSRGYASAKDFQRATARAVRDESRRAGGVRIGARG